jgi:hypothetical protein
MKFLLFNTVVGSALVYLLFGGFENIPTGEIMARVEGVAAKGSAAIFDVYHREGEVESERRQRQRVDPSLPSTNPTAAESNSASTVEPPRDLQETSLAHETPATPLLVVEVSERAVIPPHDQDLPIRVAASDAVVARSEQPSRSVTDHSESLPKFMTPRERRRELLLLAEEMELRAIKEVGE